MREIKKSLAWKKTIWKFPFIAENGRHSQKRYFLSGNSLSIRMSLSRRQVLFETGEFVLYQLEHNCAA